MIIDIIVTGFILIGIIGSGITAMLLLIPTSKDGIKLDDYEKCNGTKLCYPVDEFEMLEKCSECGKTL